MKLKAEGELQPDTASSLRAYSGSKEDGDNRLEWKDLLQSFNQQSDKKIRELHLQHI